MGQWKGNFPESSALMIYQEGFIKELIKSHTIAEYKKEESSVNYGPWSAKLLRESVGIWIGIHSELIDKQQSGDLVKTSENKYQVHCFACLIPGVLQLEWLSRLVESLQFKTK